ncbi:hypothetical protein C8J57DRAFT_1297293, partial [Mycena rebaudengoi]
MRAGRSRVPRAGRCARGVLLAVLAGCSSNPIPSLASPGLPPQLRPSFPTHYYHIHNPFHRDSIYILYTTRDAPI